MDGAYIFISYSHKDEQYVRELAQRMSNFGLQPWHFSVNQSAGINWAQRQYEVISRAKAVLVISSSASNSPDAEHVLSEVLLAMREHRLIIPLKIYPALGPLDTLLATRNWINTWDGSDPLPRILDALENLPDTPPAPAIADLAQVLVEPAIRPHVNRPAFTLALPANLALLEHGTQITLCRLGRDPRLDLVFGQALIYVSREHARIYATGDNAGATFLIADDKNRHGIFVNGERLAAPHTLLDGDQIGLGTPHTMLTFRRISATGDPPESPPWPLP